MGILFRAMKADGASPMVGNTARTLGVRVNGPDADVHPDDQGYIHPGDGGMSVAPDDPLLLANHRRPPEFLGSGHDPVWQIARGDLPHRLEYRSTSATHGQVEPQHSMPLDEYQDALGESRTSWSLTPHE